MTSRPWHTGEYQVIKAWKHLGPVVLAELLERTIPSIEAKARELRVQLEATGEDTDVSTASDWIIARIREVPSLSICPCCGRRLATMRNTGMCRACHLDQLILLRETQLAELVRERKLTKLRQDKKRMRVCEACGRPFFPRITSASMRCEDCE